MSEQKPQKQPAPMPEFDKSRNVTGGFNFWAQIYPFLNAIMFILGWFSIPVEVLLRRDFGKRWMTLINFYAGFFVLMVFTVIQTIGGAVGGYGGPHRFGNNDYNVPMGAGAHVETAPYDAGPSFWENFTSHGMAFFLLLYLLRGSYHFFRLWWRERTATALHSFEDGDSLFTPVSLLLIKLVNIIAVPVIRLYMLLLPSKERKRITDIPPLIENVRAFTKTVFEPLVLLILAIIFSGAARYWLLLSAAAGAVFSNWVELGKLNKALDFRDAVIEATGMQDITAADSPAPEKRILQQAANTIKTNPDVAAKVAPLYPDVMDIIEGMNGEK